jgi:hypothetical protein
MVIQIYVSNGHAQATTEYNSYAASGSDRTAAFYALLHKLAAAGYRGKPYEVNGDEYVAQTNIVRRGTV